MQQILVYGDSLSWGFIPNTRQRLPFHSRWTGVLEHELNTKGEAFRVIENCLNGRRTVWDDPFKPGRNGAEGLALAIEMHAPLALVVVMLGINDFQRVHHNNAWLSARGTAKLIDIIRQAPIEPGLETPDIMVVAPPAIVGARGDLVEQFQGAEKRSTGLAKELEKVAQAQNTYYFDAGSVAHLSEIDGIHLDKAQHSTLGKAIACAVLNTPPTGNGKT